MIELEKEKNKIPEKDKWEIPAIIPLIPNIRGQSLYTYITSVQNNGTYL